MATSVKQMRFGLGSATKAPTEKILMEIVQNGLFSDYGRRILKLAMKLAQEAHKDQEPRGDGRPFLLHPIETALIIIVELGILLPCVIALAILHDAVEDCPRLRAFILRHLSLGYSDRIIAISREGSKDTYHAILIVSGWVVILVKLVDRLHNLRNILHKNEDFRIKQTVETYQYFFKLLDRLEQIIPSRYAYVPGRLRRKIEFAIRRIEKSLGERGRRKLAIELKGL